MYHHRVTPLWPQANGTICQIDQKSPHRHEIGQQTMEILTYTIPEELPGHTPFLNKGTSSNRNVWKEHQNKPSSNLSTNNQ